MKSPTTPRIPTWLLQRFGVNESIVGDLIELYRAQPARTWYWRQVLFAVLAETVNEARKHSFLAIRAIVTGFVVLVLFDRVVIHLLEGVSFHGAMWVGGRLVQAGQLQSLVRPVWIASLPIGGLLAGWVVGRFHRPSMIGLFAVCFVVWQFIQFWLFVAVESVWVPLSDYLLFSTLLLVSMLFGGFRAARQSDNRHSLRVLP